MKARNDPIKEGLDNIVETIYLRFPGTELAKIAFTFIAAMLAGKYAEDATRKGKRW